MLIMLVLVGLVFGGIFGFIAFKGRMIKQFMTAQGEPTQTISSLKAEYQDWLPTREAVGSLRAVQGTELSAEVAGIVEAIYFQQGDQVTVGTPLLQLRAEADKAKLAAFNATAELARLTYQRSQAQFNVKAISQQAVDVDKANLAIALANSAEQHAIIDKKTIRAPFTGQLGLRTVDVGQYLEAGVTIASLQALDNIFVDFSLPQQQLAEIKTRQGVQLYTDSYPNQVFNGEIRVINPRVDVNTRNVQIRAVLKNPAHQLLPGMYAKVTLATGQAQRFVTLPRTAISFNAYGATVFRVEHAAAEGKNPPVLVAKQAFVTTGKTRGDQIAVIDGIHDGDEIVTSGQIKLRNGSPVRVDNTQQPSNDAAPQPIDH
jgi:membrane fusion protein (multidrug efflux system)